MTSQIIIVLILTFLINLIATLSYSVKVVGIRTGRIAISFALFNILLLISRTANGFQAPLLSKTVENDIRHGVYDNTIIFRYVILSCTLATILGGLLIPTFQRVLSRAVLSFSVHKSVPKLILHGFSKNGILYFKDNIAAVAILTIGVLSSVYAAYLNPEYRTTASSLSAFINGFATILLSIFIDPHLSVMTDDVMIGKCPEAVFRKYIVYIILARVLGTLIAQLLFLPGASLIALIATKI